MKESSTFCFFELSLLFICRVQMDLVQLVVMVPLDKGTKTFESYALAWWIGQAYSVAILLICPRNYYCSPFFCHFGGNWIRVSWIKNQEWFGLLLQISKCMINGIRMFNSSKPTVVKAMKPSYTSGLQPSNFDIINHMTRSSWNPTCLDWSCQLWICSGGSFSFQLNVTILNFNSVWTAWNQWLLLVSSPIWISGVNITFHATQFLCLKADWSSEGLSLFNSLHEIKDEIPSLPSKINFGIIQLTSWWRSFCNRECSETHLMFCDLV